MLGIGGRTAVPSHSRHATSRPTCSRPLATALPQRQRSPRTGRAGGILPPSGATVVAGPSFNCWAKGWSGSQLGHLPLSWLPNHTATQMQHRIPRTFAGFHMPGRTVGPQGPPPSCSRNAPPCPGWECRCPSVSPGAPLSAAEGRQHCARRNPAHFHS